MTKPGSQSDTAPRTSAPFPKGGAVPQGDTPPQGDAAPQGDAWFRAILASTLDPIVTIDARGMILNASDSIERVFGWKPQELIGRNVNVLMPEPHHTAHDGYLSNYRRTGQTNILNRTRPFNAVKKDGTVFPIELSVSRVDMPGHDEPLFTGILHDVTERTKVEQELARYREHLEELVEARTRELAQSHAQLQQADRLASIGTLAAGLGHDMNNVLLPIRCRLDAISTRDLPAEIVEHFEAVRSSTRYLQHLADALHLLALDPDDAEASTHSTDLSEWWEQVGPLLARALPKRVRLATTWPSDLPALAVPPHRLTQAVLNLIVNAGEAVREDEGRVRIWAEPEKDGSYIRIGVTDNGAGMSEETRLRCLDPFYTTKKRGLGTGLGLSLVQGVVRGAGGEIAIESALGRGTTITLTIPTARVKDGAAGGDSPAESGDRSIFVVAVNDARLRGLLKTLLSATGGVMTMTDPAELREAPLERAVWIVEPTPDSTAAVLHALREPDPPTIFLLDETGDDFADEPRVICIDPNDFEAIRAALAAAMETHAP